MKELERMKEYALFIASLIQDFLDEDEEEDEGGLDGLLSRIEEILEGITSKEGEQ